MTPFVKAPQAYQQGQRPLPGRYYNAPEIWAEERERIFARRWICVGRAAELAQPGDYAVRAVSGESVMVVRGQDRKSTRLNSSHLVISYAVFCLKKKKKSNIAV